MNQTMTKLYSTPSKQTDFEKIKTAAKVAEKTIGKFNNISQFIFYAICTLFSFIFMFV